MHFTQPKVSKILEDILQKEDGLNTILKLSLEALMRSEHEIFKSNVGDYSNGFRGRKVFGDKRMIEPRVPHDRRLFHTHPMR
jgi:transposase-like protein